MSPDDAQPTTDPLAATNCAACGHSESTHERTDNQPGRRRWCRGCECPNYEAPAPTTQRSPLPPREQAAISVLLLHDACAAAGLQAHLDLVAEQVRNELAEVQMSVEVLWQDCPARAAEDSYHHALAAIGRVVGLVEKMRGGK